MLSEGIKFQYGFPLRNPTIDLIVEICDQALAFEGSLIIGAVIEVLDIIDDTIDDDLVNELSIIQECIKYGLPSEKEIILYEIGFADRFIAMDLASQLELDAAPCSCRVIMSSMSEYLSASIISNVSSPGTQNTYLIPIFAIYGLTVVYVKKL